MCAEGEEVNKIEEAISKLGLDRENSLLICVNTKVGDDEFNEALIEEYYPDEPCENCDKIGGWVADVMGLVALCDECILTYYTFVAVAKKESFIIAKTWV